jgi:outer membrane protein assembly factor BamE
MPALQRGRRDFFCRRRLTNMTKSLRPVRALPSASLFAAAFLSLLAGCADGPRIPDIPLLLAPYKIDVQQGNVVTQEMVSQLKPGMSREQVKFIMGTPLVADLFHPDRWDYIYRLKKGKTGAIEERKLTLFFEKDVLARVEGDIVAASTDAALMTPAPPKQVPEAQPSGTLSAEKQPAPEEKKGFFTRLWEKLGF